MHPVPLLFPERFIGAGLNACFQHRQCKPGRKADSMVHELIVQRRLVFNQAEQLAALQMCTPVQGADAGAVYDGGADARC